MLEPNRLILLAISLIASLATAAQCFATERLFTYTYQTGVLAPGQIEIEPWATYRTGRDKFFRRLDNRVELEVGVVPGLQTAWYLNMSTQAALEGKKLSKESQIDGVSWEWKWQLSDPVADAVGLALYLEGGLGRDETEVEAKVLLDKRIGSFTLAANLVGEVEWEQVDDKEVQEVILETDLGLSWRPKAGWGLGLESRTHTEIVDGVTEHTAVFVGPNVAYAQEKWWLAATLLRQVPLAQDVDHHEHEDLEARLLVGIHL